MTCMQTLAGSSPGSPCPPKTTIWLPTRVAVWLSLHCHECQQPSALWHYANTEAFRNMHQMASAQQSKERDCAGPGTLVLTNAVVGVTQSVHCEAYLGTGGVPWTGGSVQLYVSKSSS